MGVKNVNALEEHAEKIVLAVAIAGAAFLGYLALQPVTIPGTEIGPADVEGQIAGELSRLEQAKNTVAGHKTAAPETDYLKIYRQLATQAPLDNTLIATNLVPSFGPRNMAPNASQAPLDIGNYRLATPAPVPPLNLSVEAWQHEVGILPPGAAPVGSMVQNPNLVPLQPGVQLPTRDQNAALVQGYIPVGRMLLEMARVQDPKEHLPANLAKAAVYRIRVERHEQTPNGWTAWKEITPGKGTDPATTVDWAAVGDSVENVLTTVDSEFKQIVIPDFYVDVNGVPIPPTILSRPLPPDSLKAENNKLQEDLRAAGATIGTGMGVAGVTAPGYIPMYGTPGGAVAPVTPAMPGAPATTNPAGAPGMPVQPLTLDQVRSSPIVPFAFWDETVLPAHTYQYRVQVEFVNPTYHWPYGLKNPDMQTKPLLSTGWVLVPQTVVIHPDIALFIQGSGSYGGGSSNITARVYKKNNGKWYKGEFTIPTGMNISGRIELVDKEGTPKIDVDTKYTVVDIQDVGVGVHVILKDPSGNLVTRDSAADFRNPENLDLSNKVEKRPVAAPPTAAETATPTPTPTAPPPGVRMIGDRPMYGTPIGPGPVTPPAQTRPAPVRVNPGRGG